MDGLKFCKFCGEKIPVDAVICTKCGRQIEKTDNGASGIVINNVASSAASASATASAGGAPTGVRLKNKWVSFFLCLCLGFVGAHKFYEGKIGMGILYMCTGGLFCVGWLIDIFSLLFKPNPYAVV